MNFTLELPAHDLWHTLQQIKKAVVLYGMGNGADKILSACEAYNIPVADFFASDGFVRGHSFHGKTVLSYSQAKEKYGTDGMVVLLSFASSLPSVLDTIREVAAECELYAPDVPVCGETLFCEEFFKQNEAEIITARQLLADEESLRIYDRTLAYKLSGDITHLLAAESDKESVYRLLDAGSIRRYADLGAYNGDTVRELMAYAPNLSAVLAMEPDRRSFRKLNEFCQSRENAMPAIRAVQAAAWSETATLTFGDEGNRNSGLYAKGKTVEVPAASLDDLLDGESVDYIKYDVEGAEREALIGSAGTIQAHRPRLLVSAYHKSEDLFALPLQIHALRPDYQLYYRRYPYIPAWDLNLICV
ncbi:MAG: FkbM family methyltransferase [Clostridia bacterium]|nr:FkbM family methyltransferase [Clostridia bacterium]